jgi:hypothetical protein
MSSAPPLTLKEPSSFISPLDLYYFIRNYSEAFAHLPMTSDTMTRLTVFANYYGINDEGIQSEEDLLQRITDNFFS